MKTFIAVAVAALTVSSVQADDSVTNQTRSLTLRECIERALENNLEIRFQRITPTIQTWGVMGAQGVYDPTLSGGVNNLGTTTWLSKQDAMGLGQGTNSYTDKIRQWQANAGLSGKLPTGATYDFSAFGLHEWGNTFTNETSGDTGVTLTQPLLKNFGFGVNAATIRIARENRTIAIQNFVQFVMSTISGVANAYYELVYAIENHKSAVETRELARELLEQNRIQERVGTMSPLDVIQAEAGVAESEQNVITTARAIKDNENTLKRLICQQVSEFGSATLVPVDYPPVEMVALDVAASTRRALETRPDYQSAYHALESQNITVQFNRNQLWPEIDLTGTYGLNGLGHNFDSFSDNLSSGRSPYWNVGVVLSVPLGNRQARANYHMAKLDADQALLSLKSLEQNVIVAVDDAVGHVETNLKSVEAARAATRLAQESLDAEQKKLLAGTSTTFLVLQAQTQLATTRSAQIRAEADYHESLVALDLAEGTILAKNNIVLDEKY
ncbi:MAG: TolC family protein [Verrucomicrobiia bacterium]